MFKISPRASVKLSIVLSGIFFLLCTIGAIAWPFVCDFFIEFSLFAKNTIQNFILLLLLGYGILAMLMVIDLLLIKILFRVKKGEVFTKKTVSLIRGVSFSCFLLFVLFGLGGFFYRILLFVSIFALLLGVCLRVVKNVIEEATIIKNENDLTV